MRRSTLSTLNASGINARGGHPNRGPGGGAGGPGSKSRRSSVASSNPRASIGSNRRVSSVSGVRRSSAYGTRPGAKQDPRPLSNKEYIQSCVRNLICYLTENGYDQAISPKILSSPTSKDFKSIFLFLVRRIAPDFEFERRFEDEVPALMKHFRYPFTVSKSALQAVGSPHTWPALLACLTWILELLTYDAEAGSKRESAEAAEIDPEILGSRLFFDYTKATYLAFMAGDDDFSEMDQQVESTFKVKDRDVHEQVRDLESKIDRLQQELDDSSTEEDPKAALRRQQEKLVTDVDKYTRLIEDLESYSGRTQTKLSEERSQLDKLEAEVSTLSAKKQNLLGIIATQESNAIDGQRMQRDKEEVRESMQREATRRKKADSEQVQVENQVVESTRLLDESLQEYHSLAEDLSLIPASGSNAEGREFRLAVTRDQSVTDPSEILLVNVRNELTPVVGLLMQKYSQMIKTCQGELLVLDETVDESEQKLLFKKDEVSSLTIKLRQKEAAYKSAREGLSQGLQLNADKASGLDDEIREIREQDAREIHESSQGIELADREYNSAVQKATDEVRDMNAQIEQLTELASSYLSHLRKSVSGTVVFFENQVQELGPQ